MARLVAKGETAEGSSMILLIIFSLLRRFRQQSHHCSRPCLQFLLAAGCSLSHIMLTDTTQVVATSIIRRTMARSYLSHCRERGEIKVLTKKRESMCRKSWSLTARIRNLPAKHHHLSYLYQAFVCPSEGQATTMYIKHKSTTQAAPAFPPGREVHPRQLRHYGRHRHRGRIRMKASDWAQRRQLR